MRGVQPLWLTLAGLAPASASVSVSCGVDPDSLRPPGSGGAGAGTTAGTGGAGAGPGAGGGTVDAPRGLHVVGNHIEDAGGATVVLRGVNRSGSEYMCIQNRGFFEGPSDATSVRAMTTWKINAVRVPLNESCWLGINGAPAAYSGEAYKAAIRGYISVLQSHGMVPILDLHWSGPGTTAATRLQPMPDAAHAPAFWTDVAATFLDNDGVVFEPFNEPFPDANRDSAAAWQCWRDGCTANLSVAQGEMPAMFATAGMQQMVTAIRNTGARHLLLLGGLQYSNALSQWVAYKPTDPLDNTAVAWHVYNFNACANQACWDGVPATVGAMFPIVVTEFGQRDCMGGFASSLMQWLDAHGAGYLAWTWDAYGPCSPYVSRTQPGQPWSLIADWTGTPNGGYSQAVRDHLLAR